jgi:UDP-glucose 4-epimerase
VHLGFFENKKILITGASGLIGSSLRSRLNGVKCELLCHTRKNKRTNFKNGRSVETWKMLPLGIPSFWPQLLDEFEPDIIFHLAAQTSHYEANANISKSVILNTLPIATLIDYLNQRKIFPTLITAGTATQVGLSENLPVSEKEKDLPTTIYDITKLSAELLTSFYSSLEGNSGCTLRLCNVFGYSENMQHTDRGVLNKFITKALNSEKIEIYGHGNYLRDYVYINDVIDAFLMAAENPKSVSGKAYLVGSGIKTSLLEVAQIIVSLANKTYDSKTSIEHKIIKNENSIDFRNFVADTRLIKNDIGWVAKTKLDEGIAETMKIIWDCK